MDNKDFDTFDFLINDEDEVMLLLYQREGEPLNPHIELIGCGRKIRLIISQRR